jgi:GntR family transcriptional regulator
MFASIVHTTLAINDAFQDRFLYNFCPRLNMEDVNQKYLQKGKKIPVFATIYEDLFQRLEQGEYKPGDQLPPETVLAEHYGVSRGTLRQALALLYEDGRIYNIQGKGSFVCSRSNPRPIGFEKLMHPALYCSTVPCTSSDLTYGFSPTALIIQQKLQIKPNDIALLADVTHFHDDTPIGYSFTEVPVKVLPSEGVDLNNSESVKALLNEGMFKAASTAFSRITFTVAEEDFSNRLNVPLETQIIFIEEILYNDMGSAIALYKHYLLNEYYNISILRKR